jgi:hypothetical protein
MKTIAQRLPWVSYFIAARPVAEGAQERTRAAKKNRFLALPRF